MRTTKAERKISHLLRTLGQPTRLQILMAIGGGEACVCHLEALLGQRQAYISQHLMSLRKASVLDARREGRFVYYSLRDPGVLELVRTAGSLVGVSKLLDELGARTVDTNACACPQCDILPSPAANHAG